MSTIFEGGTLILARKFSRSRFASWLKDYRVTKSAGVPTVFNILVAEPINLRRSEVPELAFITSSSAPLSIEILNRFENLYGIPINEMAGMTEAGWIAGNPPDKRKPGSVGTPFKHKRIFIRRPDGSMCREGEEGEIFVAGKSMGKGYLMPGGGIERFPEDGFPTGDIGYMDSDGYLFISGRKKDLIIRGGVNISPMEVNNILLRHPAIQEVATVGAPDATYGEEVVSFVVPKQGREINKEEIICFCKGSLPNFKAPKRVYVVDSIPKKSRGKVAKQQLLAMIKSFESE
jgi:acyl-CoA synthetase (AMP-forming)/AMP-acid ligase II